jgi:hypothetical protein
MKISVTATVSVVVLCRAALTSDVSSSGLQKATLALQSLLGFLLVQLSSVFGNVYKCMIASKLVDVRI